MKFSRLPSPFIWELENRRLRITYGLNWSWCIGANIQRRTLTVSVCLRWLCIQIYG